ncbi:MAG: 16S rRNA (cytidine(1402)-2'-O)-methyltransferase [Pseudazoarcus pumilus]|nr:16S rRNA (cytidine(1402)-2'-O)-methyltransferase [Pseudazoarcus pumilus]
MRDSASFLSSTPSLYVVATPIGHLSDISARALGVLREVDVVAAEDTRHSQRLLDAHGIRANLLALHEHNEQTAATKLIALLGEGKHVALISDAGTPGVSDPGARAVARVLEAGFAVVPVPGVCAAVAALSASGMGEGGFRFVGFLPPKSGARCTGLQALADEPVPLVFYESPHRIAECLADLAEVLGAQREIVVAREITKRHEQIARMPLGEATAWLAADPDRARGEFVLVVSGCPPVEGLPADAERVLLMLLRELPLKTAAQLAAEITGAPRKLLYARALELKQGLE